MKLRLKTFTRTLLQMSFHPYFFCIFISLWGSTHDSADCWTAHISSAAHDKLQTCTTDAMLGVVGRVPQTSWLLWWPSKPIIKLELSESCCNAYSVNTIHTICSVFIEYSEATLYIFLNSYSPFQKNSQRLLYHT